MFVALSFSRLAQSRPQRKTLEETFTVGDICTDTVINATRITAQMKKVNSIIKTTSTTKIVGETSGKNISSMSKSVKKLAVNVKEGKVNDKDFSDAAKSVEEVIDPYNTPKPSSTDSGSSSKKSNKTLYIVIGCSVGAVVIVASVIGICCCIRRKLCKDISVGDWIVLTFFIDWEKK